MAPLLGWPGSGRSPQVLWALRCTELREVSVSGFKLPGMGEVGVMAEVVDQLDGACVEIAEQSAAGVGAMSAADGAHAVAAAGAALHRLGHHPAVLPGRDAAEAVAALGVLPSVFYATHVVAVWEYADLCTALELPGETFPTGLVVLEASMDTHVVRWHPFRMHLGSPGPEGLPTVIPEWGRPGMYPDAPLPEPVVELLALWRAWQNGNIAETEAELQRAGFRVWRAPRQQAAG